MPPVRIETSSQGKSNGAPGAPGAAGLADRLLTWYDRHARDLPWRVRPGRPPDPPDPSDPSGAPDSPDPYAVWLSEIMLQQTTVAAVGPYFRDFLARWPAVRDLAAADLDEVLVAWQGLGYYARARNLHKCARAIAGEHGGRFPETEAGLRALPGIGAYTAAAIAAIAFDRHATVVDGNVERVIARLRAVEEPLPGAKARIRALAVEITPARRPGDYAQAIMDLGATICSPKRPACALCPWRADCAAHQAGIAESLPRKAPKRERPVRRGVAFWVRRGDGAVLLRRRPAEGLLGGMMEVPSTEWREGGPDEAEAVVAAPVAAEWRRLPGLARHGFTHFEIEFEVWTARIKGVGAPETEGLWWPVERLAEQALPTAMKKIVAHVLRHEEAEE
ncbi:MAG: A/G-specific adenine glycosylase [Rhodospirillaceae bacterium]|jgi:A/G-specific adenine glycosylase|nr:A/G-specific adenine glycosylase [Rhodospirillaceae bacterium]MBT6117298.1 A/G-specific adenine glycosylase [Rhodospirillaceae bacterium]